MIKFNSELPLSYMTEASVGIDLSVAEAAKVSFMDGVTLLRTGVSIAEVDKCMQSAGHIPYLQLSLRSSVGLLGLAMPAGVGIIDLDYRDEILVPVFNFGKVGEIEVERGKRIAQLILLDSLRVNGVDISSEARVGGFGSTGS